MIRIDKQLREAVMDRVEAEWDRDASSFKRRDVIREVLGQFARSGEAERYVRKDGRLAWRGTPKFRDWLREAEWECDEFA